MTDGGIKVDQVIKDWRYLGTLSSEGRGWTGIVLAGGQRENISALQYHLQGKPGEQDGKLGSLSIVRLDGTYVGDGALTSYIWQVQLSRKSIADLERRGIDVGLLQALLSVWNADVRAHEAFHHQEYWSIYSPPIHAIGVGIACSVTLARSFANTMMETDMWLQKNNRDKARELFDASFHAVSRPAEWVFSKIIAVLANAS